MSNPRLAVPEQIWRVVDLWRRCRVAGPVGAMPLLATGGGVGDQSAWLTRAFDVCDRAMQL